MWYVLLMQASAYAGFLHGRHVIPTFPRISFRVDFNRPLCVREPDPGSELIRELSGNRTMAEFKYRPENRFELELLVGDLSVNLGDIDTSLITDMSHLFHGEYSFAADDEENGREDFSGIEKWNTSRVSVK